MDSKCLTFNVNVFKLNYTEEYNAKHTKVLVS